MDGMRLIHNAHIIHGDIHPRNLLVLPTGRVVWVDFELASSRDRSGEVSLASLEGEMSYAWYWLYVRLLPWKLYMLRRLEEKGDQVDEAQKSDIEMTLVSKGSHAV